LPHQLGAHALRQTDQAAVDDRVLPAIEPDLYARLEPRQQRDRRGHGVVLVLKPQALGDGEGDPLLRLQRPARGDDQRLLPR